MAPTLTHTLTGYSAFISMLSLAASTNTLYSASPGDCTIRTWDLITGKCTASQVRPGSVAHGHLDGQRLYVGSQMRLYDECKEREVDVIYGIPQE